MESPTDAPLIFRIAGWPIESLADLRSPCFARDVDELLQNEAQIRDSANGLSQALHSFVPKILDQSDRALVLRLRRRLFGTACSLPQEQLARLLALPCLPVNVEAQLVADNALRLATEKKREELKAQYSEALAAERRYLFVVAGEPRFLKALAVASPSTALHWEQACQVDAGQARPRLVATILGYLLRAAGRATPNSLWSGICLEDTSCPSEQPLAVETALPSVVFKPDLNIFHDVLTALTHYEPSRQKLNFRLNPTLERHQDAWRYLHQQDSAWLVLEASEFPQLADIQTALTVDGPMPISRLASQSSIEEETLLGLADAGILWPAIDWPGVCADPWEALALLASQLPEPDRSRWSTAIDRLCSICRDLAANCSSGASKDLTQSLCEARRNVNALLAHYCAELVPEDRNVLIADCIAPFRITASADFRTKLRQSITEYWQFDRGGTGERLARGQRIGLNLADDPSLFDAWTEALGSQHKSHRVLVRNLMPVTDGMPLPPGSALVLAKFTNGRCSLRMGSFTPDFCTFYSRFHHLLPSQNPFESWLRQTLDGLHRIDGVFLSDTVLHGSHDRNAALRPRLTSNLIDPFSGNHNPQKPLIVLLNSAVDLSLADPYSRRIQEEVQLRSRPSLMCPQPPLAAELESWRHLPRLELRDDFVIGPERWYFPDAELARWAKLDGFERFLAWRQLVAELELPEMVYAHASDRRTESLVLADSILTVELLARSLPHPPAWLRFQEVFAQPEELWLKDQEGFHYVAEIAFAWGGSDAFWEELAAAQAVRFSG